MWAKHIVMVAAPVMAVAIAVPAAAQGIPVFDTTTYLQALQTARQTLTMVEQGRQQVQTAASQLGALQKLTNVNGIARNLFDAQVRNLLPTATIDTGTLLGGDLTRIGSLGTIAADIQSRYRLSASGSSGADEAYNQALKDSTGSAAATAALGENTLSVTQARMQGLDQLRTHLSDARDPKDVMDLQARIAVEQAHLQNDMLKMQAIQLAQAGEANLGISAGELAAGRDAAAFYDANIIRN